MGIRIDGKADNRLLPERSRLEFHYTDGDSPNKMVVFIPFFENPIIRESKKATYTTYNPIGRSSSLYAYVGSPSRKIHIEATYTLDHLARHDMGIDRFRRLVDLNSNQAQRDLFTSRADGTHKGLIGDGYTSQARNALHRYWDLLTQQDLGISLDTSLEIFETATNAGLAALGLPTFGMGTNIEQEEIPLDTPIVDDSWSQRAPNTEKLKTIDTLLFFVNVLRTSVSNNAVNPIYGPPLIRLVHGTLYQSIPCICKSYTLEWIEDMGYELETLTPRRLRLKLELEEIRTGDFTDFVPADPIKKDNLAGWEAAINSPLTTDPQQFDADS
jgi:hypothetical protein